MTRAVLHGDGSPSATLHFMGQARPAVIGASGIRPVKVEGDHGTPVGVLPLRQVFYRADRTARPITTLPLEPLSPTDGWCDDQSDANYNRFVALPYPAGHERLWRDDHVYDLVVVLGHNDAPPVPGRGSAIFLHLPPADGRPTEGCIAVPEAVLRDLLRDGLTEIEVLPPA
ncbi:L,D-transpeptidase family protein [Ameyamaea chiangmaiensis]